MFATETKENPGIKWCPWCDKVKYPGGEWEKGLAEKLRGVTHKICPECFSKLYKEAGMEEEKKVV